MVAITKFNRDDIFDAVKLMYTSVANEPQRGFHFPTGRPACEYLGYPATQLDVVPATAVESFAGVGYPFRCQVIDEGNAVLDIGAGAGTDALIAALLAGPAGKVYGLDMTRAMHEKLRRNAAQMGISNVEPLLGNAEDIPLADESVDVVTSNGVLNLVPDKIRAYGEIFRVLKPGGRIQISDIVINKHFDALEASRHNSRLWAECIVGAMHRDELIASFKATGLTDLRELDETDYFARSPAESTRGTAAYFGAVSITITGRKP